MLYDPFTYDTLMAGMVLKFEQQPLNSLAGEIEIEGPGIYCLLYIGDHEAYSAISTTETPIYAGKAAPPGSRRGDDGNIEARSLQARIRQHKRSIEAAQNLRVDDFTYRSLAIVPAWINIAERFVIQHYRPVWNACLDGFGDHDPGQGRYNGERSWWDTLHPGREWAEKLQGKKTVPDSLARVTQFFYPPQDSPQPTLSTTEQQDTYSERGEAE